MLNLSDDDVVLEVGSGLGYLSALCALRLGSQNVRTYEANPELIAVIARNHALNGVAPEVVNAMLSEVAGTTRFFPSENFFSSSGLAEGSGSRSIQVPTLSARDEFRDFRPTFVLMDIEGGEALLVPHIDWTGVNKLAIELHPDVLSARAIDDVLNHLRDAGLREHPLLSSHRKRFFSRQVGRGRI